jgi:hypothetical protein
MTKVCILQTDNRPKLGYLLYSQHANNLTCDYFGYNYEFILMDDSKHTHLHPCTKKIFIVNEFINRSTEDVLIFLDSDAWVHNGPWLNDMIENLMKDETKHGCFSRDPYVLNNTFINSGAFIIKINEFTKNMYVSIINSLESDTSHHNKWPYDQFYVSNYVFINKDKFNIFIPNTLNTPVGEVLKHDWFKHKKMYENLQKIYDEGIIKTATPFEIEKYYDTACYPNIDENGETYDYIWKSCM